MQKCCAEVLDRIQTRIESEKTLANVLKAGPSLMALGFGFTGKGLLVKLLLVPVKTAINNAKANSGKLKLVSVTVPAMARAAICKDITLHLLDHQNEPEEEFWEEMSKTYCPPR